MENPDAEVRVDYEVSPRQVGASFDQNPKEEEMKRHKMSRKGSKRNFTKHAVKVHRKNVPQRMPMRGGIRL